MCACVCECVSLFEPLECSASAILTTVVTFFLSLHLGACVLIARGLRTSEAQVKQPALISHTDNSIPRERVRVEFQVHHNSTIAEHFRDER